MSGWYLGSSAKGGFEEDKPGVKTRQTSYVAMPVNQKKEVRVLSEQQHWTEEVGDVSKGPRQIRAYRVSLVWGSPAEGS